MILRENFVISGCYRYFRGYVNLVKVWFMIMRLWIFLLGDIK